MIEVLLIYSICTLSMFHHNLKSSLWITQFQPTPRPKWVHTLLLNLTWTVFQFLESDNVRFVKEFNGISPSTEGIIAKVYTSKLTTGRVRHHIHVHVSSESVTYNNPGSLHLQGFLWSMEWKGGDCWKGTFRHSRRCFVSLRYCILGWFKASLGLSKICLIISIIRCYMSFASAATDGFYCPFCNGSDCPHHLFPLYHRLVW